MPGSASLFHMHALLESDYAILNFALFCFVARQKGGGEWHNTPTLNTPLDVHVLMVRA